MSKSRGNVIAPQDVVENHGADVLRLWVVGSDYAEDLRIGSAILKQHADIYRRLRNTLRFLLGNLAGFSESERLPPEKMPELERWVLHRLVEVDRSLRQACDAFEFHGLFAELHSFCAVELSAFYFDIRKDSLYCDREDRVRRRAVRTVLDILFDCLTAWLAPFICFTAEEAWLARHPGEGSSVHLRLFPTLPASWRDDALAERFAVLRRLRRVVTGALEVERAARRIGSSLQASAAVYADAEYHEAVRGIDLAELFITSSAGMAEGPAPGAAPAGAFRLADVPGVAVVIGPADGRKCERCWQVLAEVGRRSDHPDICQRCADAVAHHRAAAE